MTIATSAVDPAPASARAARTIDCPACGCSEGRVLLTTDDVRGEQLWLKRFHAARRDEPAGEAKDHAQFTQAESRTVSSCTACGTVLRTPRPSPEQVEKRYEHDRYGTDVLQRLAANQDRFFVDKLAQLAPYFAALRGGAPVLEIGSFVGGFLHAAEQRGWNALGIDVGEETTDFTRARGFDVRRGDVADLDLPASSYEAVFVWSTFDQLGDPGEVLDRAAELLRPGGLLVLRVPNGRFETACVEIRRAARGTRRAHNILCAQAYNNFVSFPYLTGYTPESLCGMLEGHGFGCERVQGDTILSLADDRTLPFAVREEARLKRAVSRACRRAETTTGLLFDPWIDVIARRTGVH
jgi:SAM-dependent methyltransferase